MLLNKAILKYKKLINISFIILYWLSKGCTSLKKEEMHLLLKADI